MIPPRSCRSRIDRLFLRRRNALNAGADDNPKARSANVLARVPARRVFHENMARYSSVPRVSMHPPFKAILACTFCPSLLYALFLPQETCIAAGRNRMHTAELGFARVSMKRVQRMNSIIEEIWQRRNDDSLK
jgi:hypothetical protein